MIFSRVVKMRSEIGSLSCLALSVVFMVPFWLDLSVVGHVMMGTTAHCTLRESDSHLDLQQNKSRVNSAQLGNGLFVIQYERVKI